MIQRIQTLYLLFVVMLCFSGLFLPLLAFHNDVSVVASMNNWYVSAYNKSIIGIESCAPSVLGVLLLFIMMLSLVAIFLFHYRMRQMRIVIFSTILLVGYILLYVLGFLKYSIEISTYPDMADISSEIKIAAIFPLISIILNCMAIHGIRRDEQIIRSLDRLR